MNVSHLSDEAVAAFADGVLRGHSRERAAKHVEMCPECLDAVRGQREAVFALRAAPAPSLPTALSDRLRSVPMTTPIIAPIAATPAAMSPDGHAMFAAFGAAAFVDPALMDPARSGLAQTEADPTSDAGAVSSATDTGPHTWVKPAALTVAAMALAGSLAAGSVARQAGRAPGAGVTAQQISSRHSDVDSPADSFGGVRP